MKIYTKTGDDGSTGLFGGSRVPKHDARVEAYGTVDELNSVLGLALADDGPEDIRNLLVPHQSELFSLGAILASDGKGATKLRPDLIDVMEQQIDGFDNELEPLKNFILPGGTRLAAWLHLARTVCRRAEREVSRIRENQPRLAQTVMPGLKYLNRLSDWLFTLARVANLRANVPDVPWKSQTPDE